MAYEHAAESMERMGKKEIESVISQGDAMAASAMIREALLPS